MYFPRLKDEHLPCRYEAGKLRLGAAVEFDDPHGWLWAALTFLDGRRRPGEVAERLVLLFPDLTITEAADVVDALVTSDYVTSECREDIGHPDLGP